MLPTTKILEDSVGVGRAGEGVSSYEEHDGRRRLGYDDDDDGGGFKHTNSDVETTTSAINNTRTLSP